jgi:hypothetical protein
MVEGVEGVEVVADAAEAAGAAKVELVGFGVFTARTVAVSLT